MKAIAYTRSLPADDPEALVEVEVRDPAPPRGHELLVEVRAVSVNPVDTKIRRGGDPLGEPHVLGFDAAGVVRATGPEASLLRVGDEVYYAGSIDRPGTNAPLHLVDERIVGHKPKTLSFAKAAAMPLTTITAWEALFDRLQIPRNAPARGGALLIIGGAGGVGSMAVQLARRLTGLRVIATASRPETREWCLSLGAHDVVDHSSDLVAQLKAMNVAPQYIFSTHTTERNWKAAAELIAPQGRIALIEAQGPVDARDVMRKSVSIHCEWMFTRPVFDTPDKVAQHRLLEEVAELVDRGILQTTMTEHYGRITAANLMRAHAAIEGGQVRGKIVLEGF